MAATEGVTNVTGQDHTEEILTLKNEVQYPRQTERDKTKQDAVHMEFKSRRTELELEYWGMKLQEQRSKLKLEQERHDVAMTENFFEVLIRHDEYKERMAEKESLSQRFETGIPPG